MLEYQVAGERKAVLPKCLDGKEKGITLADQKNGWPT
jgi:hypothetical protein